MSWDEVLHPRDRKGEFATVAAAVSVKHRSGDGEVHDEPGRTAGAHPRAAGVNVRHHYTPSVSVPASAAAPGTPARDVRVPGVTVRGDRVITPHELPATVYHVTTNLSAVNESGHLRAGGVGGLGGDSKDRIVSMTVDKHIADLLQGDIRFVGGLARGYPDTDYDTPQRAAANVAALDKLVAQSKAEGWDWTAGANDLRKHDFVMRQYDIKDVLNQYYNARSFRADIPNPLFFSDLATLRKIDPANVGTVSIPRENLDTGALLVDFDTHQRGSLKEVRLYGDVPLGRR